VKYVAWGPNAQSRFSRVIETHHPAASWNSLYHDHMHFRSALVLVLFIVAQTAANAQKQDTHQAKTMPELDVAAKAESLDLNMYSRIRDEGFKHSRVMEYASALFDDIGPRLTGSSAMARANEWTRAQLAAMGWSNAHLES
jgi:hypothetical protein